MKIAIVTRDYNRRGGIEKISQAYARLLHERGNEVHVWCSDLDRTEADRGIDFHQLKLNCGKGWLYILLFALLVGRQMRSHKYDAVIVMGVAGLVKGSFIVANSVHKEWFKYSLSITKPFTLRWWLKLCNIKHYVVILLETLQYRSGAYNRIIAVSEPTKNELSSCYNVPKRDVDVLPNGADHKLLEPDVHSRLQVREQLGIGADEYLLCMLVNEIERKGVPQALSALLRLSHLPLKLLVAGRFERSQCIRLAQDLGVIDKLICVPSTTDVRKYLWASDLYVLPTQYEAWNVSIMEAQAAGLPVITTKLNQADSIIVPGENGFLLYDPLDIVELSAAVERWCMRADKQSMADKARERAAEYDWTNLVEQLEQIVSGRAGGKFLARSVSSKQIAGVR